MTKQYRDAASNSRKAGHDPRCGRERRQEARRIGLEHKGSGKASRPRPQRKRDWELVTP
jgi:hypothetical protein